MGLATCVFSRVFYDLWHWCREERKRKKKEHELTVKIEIENPISPSGAFACSETFRVGKEFFAEDGGVIDFLGDLVDGNGKRIPAVVVKKDVYIELQKEARHRTLFLSQPGIPNPRKRNI